MDKVEGMASLLCIVGCFITPILTISGLIYIWVTMP